jgi:hypothetical protein
MAADNTNKGIYHQIRDQFFYVEISLYNQIEGEIPLYVPFFFVDSLRIHESIFNWITKGEIVFNSDFEIFARGALKKDASNSKSKAPYIDRTDGRNRIHINIYPVDVTNKGDIITDNADNEKKFPKKYWEINQDFVVVDIEDLPIDDAQRKKRMYVFVDERYQVLKEKNLEWSSATIAAKKLNSEAGRLKDSEAAMNPNEVLKELLKLAATNGDTMPQIKIGFDKDGSIDKPNVPLDKINEENWDKGDEANKVLFYPTANSNAVEDIFYILSHCVSKDGFPVILDYGRSSADKGWHLTSLSKIFEDSTKEQVERLIIEDGLTPESDGNSNTQPYVPRADDTGASQTKNFTSIVASKIKSYKFSPMVAVDDNRLMNSPYVYFNEHTGEFKLMKEKNSIKNLITKLKELSKELYTFKNAKSFKPQVLLSVNKTKATGQMTKNQLALNGPYSSQTAPLNQMIFDSIYLNQSVTFQALGLTLRTPGKFIFIDRVAASGDTNPFDDRFLGQWMMTNVSHLFTQSTYMTEVVANKIDSFSSLWPEEDSNY